MDSDFFKQLLADIALSGPALGLIAYVMFSALFLRLLGFNWDEKHREDEEGK